jgi:hypothetical protein
VRLSLKNSLSGTNMDEILEDIIGTVLAACSKAIEIDVFVN